MEKRDERTSKAQHYDGGNEPSTRRPWSRPTLVRLLAAEGTESGFYEGSDHEYTYISS